LTNPVRGEVEGALGPGGGAGVIIGVGAGGSIGVSVGCEHGKTSPDPPGKQVVGVVEGMMIGETGTTGCAGRAICANAAGASAALATKARIGGVNLRADRIFRIGHTSFRTGGGESLGKMRQARIGRNAWRNFSVHGFAML
jgi:hypothetical protein